MTKVASHDEISKSLRAFVDGYNRNARLKAMNRDWNRTVLVQATDIPSQHTLVLRDGELTLLEGAAGEADLTVTAGSDLLADLFAGEITPTEPYLDGRLKVLGREEDIIRLDFISLMIWGE